MEKVKIVLGLITCFSYLGCASIKMGTVIKQKPITFNLVYTQKSISFKIEQEYIYWFGINMNNSRNISELLNDELRKHHGSKGIMNLKIRYFDSFHDSSQSFYINPFTFIGSQIFSGASAIILFNKKSVEISGEVYF
jgi:hypothetical protein